MSLSRNMMWSPSDYDECSVLAREAGEALLERLEWMTLKPKVIVEAGCGTGWMSHRLLERYPDAEVVAVDNSPAMIAHATQQPHPRLTYHGVDAAALPLANHSVDLLMANFLVPWHVDVASLLREWRRVLRPDGLLMFTALGPDTLREWQSLFRHEVVPLLVDMHDVGDGLLSAGFVDPVLDVNHYTMTYRDPEKLIKELVASGMLAAPLTLDNLETITPTEDGAWPLTYEVIYAHAFVPADSDEISASSDGLIRVPLAHLRQRMRGR